MDKIIDDSFNYTNKSLPTNPNHVSVTTEVVKIDGRSIIGIHILLNINDKIWSFASDTSKDDIMPSLESCEYIAKTLAKKFEEKYSCTTFASIKVGGVWP